MKNERGKTCLMFSYENQVEPETQLQWETIYPIVICLGSSSTDKKILSNLVDFGCVCRWMVRGW